MSDPVERSGAEGARWRVREVVDLLWRDWGDDSIVLEARSAQIFHFDPLASAVMACLEQGPATIDGVAAELAADLQADLQADEGAGLRGTVGEIVDHFRELGWVEPIID